MSHSLSNLLLLYAQQFEDQHAPHNMTIALREAAAEIARLKAEVARLRSALEPLSCTCPAKHADECSRSEVDCPFWNARAALTQEKTDVDDKGHAI